MNSSDEDSEQEKEVVELAEKQVEAPPVPLEEATHTQPVEKVAKKSDSGINTKGKEGFKLQVVDILIRCSEITREVSCNRRRG